MKKLVVIQVCAFIFLTIATPVTSLAQKAFVATTYQGNIYKLPVTLQVANGYFAGNEIKLYNRSTRKVSRFLTGIESVNDSLSTKFYHYSTTGKKFTDYFLVEGLQENYDVMPRQFAARYFTGTHAVKFILRRKV